jgi:L-malate glycosyltransferase
MPAQVLADLGKLKKFYSGLGQFSYYFGKNLSRVNDDNLTWNFLTPETYYRKFDIKGNYEFLSFKRRYFPSWCRPYDLWHAIHQDSAYWPGHDHTKYILTIHDLNFLREKGSLRIKSRLENLQQKIDRASYVTFISNFTASEVHRYLDLGSKPTKVIHNGVEIETDLEVARPGYVPEEKFLFSLGMILEKKNFHVLVDFMQINKNYKLVIAGDKSYRYGKRLEREISRKKLSDQIIMPGIISHEDKIYLFKNCEAFLFPSLNEGFGLPVIEAMRFGKPVFISKFSSLPEIGGEHAYYWEKFEPGYMKDLFDEKMNQFKNNEEELSEKLKAYSRKYSWEKSIMEYLNVYRELLPGPVIAPGHSVGQTVIPANVKRPIRVLHLSSEKDWRGGEQQIAYLVSELSRLGIQNIVGCEKDSRFEQVCRENNWVYFTSRFSLSVNPGTSAKVAGICREKNIDILHLHTSRSHTVGVVSTLFGHPARLVLTRRVDNPIGTNFLSQWKYNHPRIKRIITVSDKIKEVLTKVLKQPEKCITIHSGIDTSRFNVTGDRTKIRKLAGAGPDDLLVGNTSALAAHKDYFTFINTCEWVVSKGLKTKFVIIGEGPEEQKIRRYISTKNLEAHIVLTGFRKDIPQLLPGFDIFLMTSVTEGLGTSILDAFAAKVPVVATRAGGIPEMVKDGETGLLADPGDFTRLGEHILRLSEDKQMCARLTDGATRYLNADFTREIMTQKVLNVYNEILGYPVN